MSSAQQTQEKMPKRTLAMKRLGLLRKGEIRSSGQRCVGNIPSKPKAPNYQTAPAAAGPGSGLNRRAHISRGNNPHYKAHPDRAEQCPTGSTSRAAEGKPAQKCVNERAARVRSMEEHWQEAGWGQAWSVGQSEVAVPSSIRHPAPCQRLHDWARGPAALFVFNPCTCMFE